MIGLRTISVVLGAGALALGCDVKEIEPDGGDEVPAGVQGAFDRACATPSCHVGASPAGGLNLEAGQSGSILSTSSSTGVPFVTFGDLANSYIAIKVLPDDRQPEGAPARAGGQMPPNDADPLDMAIIVAWIAGITVEQPLDIPEPTSLACLAAEEVPPTPSFATDVYPIFMNSCGIGGCHGPNGTPALQLPQDPMGTYDGLVGVMDAISGLNYVEAGAPDQSFLWHKVNNTFGVFDPTESATRMPPSTLPMCPTDLELIYRWILTGANP